MVALGVFVMVVRAALAASSVAKISRASTRTLAAATVSTTSVASLNCRRSAARNPSWSKFATSPATVKTASVT